MGFTYVGCLARVNAVVCDHGGPGVGAAYGVLGPHRDGHAARDGGDASRHTARKPVHPG